jgi:hypothetical protein
VNIYCAYGYPDIAWNYYREVRKRFDQAIDARLLANLTRSAIGNKSTELAVECVDEFEKQTAVADHDPYIVTRLMYCRAQILSSWFDAKEYARVVKQADAYLQKFDALMKNEDGNKRWGPGNANEYKSMFMNLEGADRRVPVLFWKARARFELGEKEGLLDDIIGVAKALEADKSFEGRDSYECYRFDSIAGAYSSIADLANTMKLESEAGEYRKLAEENVKKAQECRDRMKPLK